MCSKLKKETELSPFVIKYWKQKGYCVHGEVAVFARSTFIDHVAHTGPCSNPDHVVGIEMKKGAGKNLQKQIISLDRKHVVDEMWGVVYTNPRSSTLKKWKTLGRWSTPGLLVLEENELTLKQSPSVIKDDSRYKKYNWLLLVEANKDVIAGYSSSNDKHSYVTHFSSIKDTLEKEILSSGEPSPLKRIKEAIPENVLAPYRSKKGAIRRALNVLEVEERKIKLVKKKGKMKYYGSASKDHWVIDKRFDDLYDVSD